MNSPNGKGLTWPTQRMAKLILVTPRRLQQLVQECVVPKCEARGRYNPIAVTQSYIRFLRDRVQSPELSDGEFYAAKLAKIKAERASIELDMEIKRGSRIPLEDVARSSNEIFMMSAGTLKANRDKVMTEETINEIFTTLREWAQDWRRQADAAPPCNGELWNSYELGTAAVDAEPGRPV